MPTRVGRIADKKLAGKTTKIGARVTKPRARAKTRTPSRRLGR